MSDKEQQEEELLALTSIYDETVISVSEDGEALGGQFLVSLHIPENFKIKTVNKENQEECHTVKFLPPIELNFQYPKDYPSASSPEFTLSCKWLNRKQLSALCKKLDDIWELEKPCVIIYMWTSFLQDESHDFLGLSDSLDISTKNQIQRQDSVDSYDPRGIQDIASHDRLLATLLDYDKQARQIEFDKSLFECKVCFCDKMGSQCINFYNCNHVYCKDCMKDYFTVQIGEGNVNGLYCPEDKCESQAHPSQVKELVPKELYTKYDQMLLQNGLDTMLDIAYCPRPSCQQAVICDRESSMGSCASCGFVFCTLCKLSYHGLSPCRVKADGLQKLKDEWMNADEPTRKLLEKRYGKVAIKMACEECFSNEWLEQFAKKCPRCSAQIQKIDGCNKMTCMKCRAHFCWLCNAVLPKANPYTHFNEASGNCFNRLFEGVDVDDDGGWDDWM